MICETYSQGLVHEYLTHIEKLEQSESELDIVLAQFGGRKPDMKMPQEAGDLEEDGEDDGRARRFVRQLGSPQSIRKPKKPKEEISKNEIRNFEKHGKCKEKHTRLMEKAWDILWDTIFHHRAEFARQHVEEEMTPKDVWQWLEKMDRVGKQFIGDNLQAIHSEEVGKDGVYKLALRYRVHISRIVESGHELPIDEVLLSFTRALRNAKGKYAAILREMDNTEFEDWPSVVRLAETWAGWYGEEPSQPVEQKPQQAQYVNDSICHAWQRGHCPRKRIAGGCIQNNTNNNSSNNDRAKRKVLEVVEVKVAEVAKVNSNNNHNQMVGKVKVVVDAVVVMAVLNARTKHEGNLVMSLLRCIRATLETRTQSIRR